VNQKEWLVFSEAPQPPWRCGQKKRPTLLHWQVGAALGRRRSLSDRQSQRRGAAAAGHTPTMRMRNGNAFFAVVFRFVLITFH
jgi:hypothetical protein